LHREPPSLRFSLLKRAAVDALREKQFDLKSIIQDQPIHDAAEDLFGTDRCSKVLNSQITKSAL
jgi:hypothetical protein